MKSIGAALREAREYAKLSQTAVSKRAGLALGQLSKIESGQNASPEFATVARIATALGMSLDSLASECGYAVAMAGGEVQTLHRRLSTASEKLQSAMRGHAAVSNDVQGALQEVEAELRKLSPQRGKRTRR